MALAHGSEGKFHIYCPKIVNLIGLSLAENSLKAQIGSAVILSLIGLPHFPEFSSESVYPHTASN